MKEKHIHQAHHYTQTELSQAYRLFFGTLISPGRLQIIRLLRKKALTVSELMQELRFEQTALSHDLARLRRCGFVTVAKKGKHRVYALAGNIEGLMRRIDAHMKEHCIHIVRGEKK